MSIKTKMHIDWDHYFPWPDEEGKLTRCCSFASRQSTKHPFPSYLFVYLPTSFLLIYLVATVPVLRVDRGVPQRGHWRRKPMPSRAPLASKARKAGRFNHLSESQHCTRVVKSKHVILMIFLFPRAKMTFLLSVWSALARTTGGRLY